MNQSQPLRVAGCIVWYNEKILFLLRSATETDPSLWGIPAGKVEPGESNLDAVIREVFEETRIQLTAAQLTTLDTLTIVYDDFTVQFPLFFVRLEEEPKITLDNREHIDFKWLTPTEALQLPNLMKDVDAIITNYCFSL